MLKVHVIHTAVIERLTIITSPHISLSFFSKLKIKKKKKEPMSQQHDLCIGDKRSYL